MVLLPGAKDRPGDKAVLFQDSTVFLRYTTTLPTVAQAISDLQAAETATLARTKGAAATRNEKRTALVRTAPTAERNDPPSHFDPHWSDE